MRYMKINERIFELMRPSAHFLYIKESNTHIIFIFQKETDLGGLCTQLTLNLVKPHLNSLKVIPHLHFLLALLLVFMHFMLHFFCFFHFFDSSNYKCQVIYL